MSTKKKFLKEIYKLLGETDERNVRPLTVSPDVADLAGLLRCCGFRLSKVDLKPVARASLLPAVTTCSVQLTCARSGLNVILESDGVCRCPEAATSADESVSTWVVESPVSPSCSQENLSKSEQAGISLLPEVSPAAAEVLSVAVSSIMKLMEEECATRKTGNLGSPAATEKKPLRPLSTESNLHVSGQLGRSCSELVQTRSLDGLGWEAATKNIVPTFQELSISAISSASKSEEQLLSVIQHPPPVAEASTEPHSPATREIPPPPRRQSSTFEDYLTFKQCLGDNNCDPTTFQASSASGSSGANGSAVGSLPSMRAQHMLEKVQVARQNLDDLILSLQECIGGSEIGEAAAAPPAAAVTPLERTRAKQKTHSGGIPGLRKTEVATRPKATKASILKTLRRETVAVPSSNSGTPRPRQLRLLMGPAPDPPKVFHAPPTPVPRPAKADVKLPTKSTPRPPKQGLRRLSASSSQSGPSSLPFIPGSSLIGSQPSRIASLSTNQRRLSDGICSLTNPHGRRV